MPDEDDATAFRRAMEGVAALPNALRNRVPPAPGTRAGHRTIRPPAADGLRDELLRPAYFDVYYDLEHVEGLAAGQDRRILGRLRAGEFSWRMHLDLHGLTVPEAQSALDRFLAEALCREERCVVVVHGRGLNSPGEPVLKRTVIERLSRGRWARHVLAFVSARPCDGGTGALYVLLRRRQPAKPNIAVVRGPGL